ncbi:MAG: hypothetical protein WCB22_11200, partial [Pseudolabrys sp.]
LKNGACLELERQIGIVGKVRPIVVVICVCLIFSEEGLRFEFGPTLHNIRYQGCNIRIADEFPFPALLEITADGKRKENSVGFERKSLIDQQ